MRNGASVRRGFAAGALAWACGVAAHAWAVEMVGRVSHPALAEVSGLVKSARGDFFWTHNDSGDAPRLFAIDAAGAPLWPAWRRLAAADWPGHAIANAAHFDWEAITLHEGVLYIADVGNNGNARRDLGVYVVHEPDPLAVDKMRALLFLPIRYPDQVEHPGETWHFDCESVFVADGKLHFITKHRESGRIDRAERGAKLYRLETRHTDRENVLALVGRHDGIRWATDAALSADASRLVVASPESALAVRAAGAARRLVFRQDVETAADPARGQAARSGGVDRRRHAAAHQRAARRDARQRGGLRAGPVTAW